MELSTDEMGVEVGDFSPPQNEPSILVLLVGQAGSSCQEVMEGIESRAVMYPCCARVIGGYFMASMV